MILLPDFFQEELFMAERFRDEQISFRVTSFDRDIIMQNYKESGLNSFREFAVKVLTDGYIVNVDSSELHSYTYEINKIGVNINQIAHKINMLDKDSPDIYLLKQDVQECLFLMNELVKTVRRHWLS